MGHLPHSRTLKHVRVQAVIAGLVLVGVLATLRVALAAAPDNSLSFNGSSAYVRIGAADSNPDKLNASSFTLEAWFNRSGAGAPVSTGTGGIASAVALIAKGRGEADVGDNRDFNYFFGLDSTFHLVADYEEGAGQASPSLNHPIIGSTVIATGGWHHAAATLNASTGTWTLYLDGRIEATTSVGSNRAPRSDSIQDTSIGAALTSGLASPANGPAGFFQGMIDEVRIWNTVRTFEQIRDTKDDELTSGTGLVGRWGLDEGSGTTAADSTSNPLTGTLSGTTVPTWTLNQYNFLQDTTPPAAPAGAAAVARNGAVDLTWTANSETDLVGYNIYRGTSPGVSTTGTPLNGDNPLTGASPSYTDASATNGTTYYYAVTAVDTANNKAPSEVSATPSATLSSLRLDGVNDYVTFGPAPSLATPTFTLETWFKRTGTGVGTSTGSGGITAVPLITKGRAEAEGSNVDMNYFLGIDASNKLAVDFEEGPGGTGPLGQNHPLIGNTVVTNGAWHHAAATYDGSSWKIYLDGQLDGSLAVSQPARGDSIQHAALGTAMNSTGAAAGFFQGVMDEARIWNVARSQAAIQSTMNQELVAANGLIGRWGLNEGTGTVAGDSNGSTDGALANGPTWVVGQTLTAPPAGQYALRFNGSSQYVSFGPAPGLATPTFTLETWFKRTGTGIGQQTGNGGLTSAVPLISKGRNEAEGSNVDMNYFLGIDTATNALAVDFEEGPNGTGPLGQNHPLIGQTAVTLNVWHHAAATYDGSMWKIYLDGRLDKSASVNEPARGDSVQWAALGTAMDSSGVAGGFFQGAMDEARIWSYARSGTEIRTNKDTTTPGTTGLLGQWHLDENVGNSFADASGHGIVGTGTGGAHVSPYGFPQDSTPPAALQNMNAQSGFNQIIINWDDSSEPDAAGYNIWRSATTPVDTTGTPLNGGDLLADSAYTDDGLTPGFTYHYAVKAVDGANNSSAPAEASATLVPTDPQLVGAGDIANCNTNPPRTQQIDTANLINGIPGVAFTIGDNAYDNGLASEFTPCYDDSWGQFKNRTRPAPGNHDYGNGTNDGSGYFDYFDGVGQQSGPAGDRDLGYYSYDVGDYWHIVVLNSECYYWDICTGGPAAEEAWLDADLSANGTRNVFAIYHKPRWSSGNSYFSGAGITVLQPLWQILYDHGVEAVFNGHDHHYERFAPINAAGQLDNTYGMREFIVGTGGAALSGLQTPMPNSERRNNTTYGVIKLNLHQSSYDWQFIPTTPSGFTDSGTQAVHGPPPDTTSPVVAITSVNPPSLDFSDTSTDVTWHANENGPYSVRVGGTTCGNGSQVASGTYSTSPADITTNLLASSLVDGDNTVRVCVTDGNNNTGSDTAIIPKNSTPPANALSFDGSGDSVDFGPATNTLGVSTFTLETWFKRTGSGTAVSTGTGGLTAVPLVTKGLHENDTPANVNMNYFLGIDPTDGHLMADFEDTTGGDNHPVEGTTPVAISSTAWHHAAATYDGSTWRLYLDGRLETKQDEVGTPESTSIQHAALGTAINSTAVAEGSFAGVLDEVRIWGVARTGTQIRANKNVESLSDITGLLGQWHLNQATGTNVLDASGNNVTGTLTGATWVAGFGFPQDAIPPAAPTGLNATPGDRSAVVDWNDSGAADIAGYNIWRSLTTPVDTSGAPLNGEDLLLSSLFNDSGLTNATTYYYAVKAVDTSNNSSAASEDNVVPADTAPPIVTIDSVNPPALGFGDASADLTWHANENGAYEVQLGGTTCANGTALQAGTYSTAPSGVVTVINASDLAEGNNTIRVCVSDDALNTGSNSTTVSKSSTPPTNGLSFDGNDYVDFGEAHATLGATTFTIETWFKRTGTGTPTNTGSNGIASAIPLVTKGLHEADTPANLNMNYFLGIDSTSGVLVADFEDTATGGNHPVSGVTAITSNVWHHAAATYDGTTWRLYLDGRMDAKATANATPESSSIQHAALGSALNSTGAPEGFFVGLLDEVRIWDIARTGPQVRANKNAEAPTPSTGLVGQWHLNQLSGSTAIDSSGDNVTGTLFGPPAWTSGNAFVVDATAPAGPTGLHATPDDQQIGLTWDPNLETDLAGYDLYRSTTSPVSTGGTPVNGADLITGESYTDTGLTNGTRYYYALVAVDGSNNRSSASAEDSAIPVVGDPQIVGAGDIADCSSQATQDGAAATAGLVSGISGGVFTLGDNVYQNGLLTEFQNCYALSWGQAGIKSRTRPAPGNHDYGRGNAANDGSGYYDYFNGVGQQTGPAGDRTVGYYSYDVGPYWHIVVLNSECFFATVCAGGTAAEVTWLQNDLIANAGKNVMAMMHHPRWSSGASNPGLSSLQPLWQLMYDYGVEALFVGHDHHYERFAPQNASGALDLPSGVREFIVGTGGASNTGIGTTVANSEVRNSVTDGVIKLKLHQSSYDWQFIPTTQGGFTDGGTQAVHGVPNVRPVIDSVTISPTSPTTNQTLSATVTSHDPNGGTITYAYQWLKNGVALSGQTGATLNLATAGNGDKNDAITVRVTGSDEIGPGAPLTSSAVTVANSAPSTTVSLSPDPPSTNQTLTATATRSDPDIADTVTLTYAWKVNGTTRKTTSNSASLIDTFDLSLAGNGDAGQTVSVEVTPSDGTASGTLATDSVVVAAALAPPSGLTTLLTTNAVVLDWANNTESNLAGYNVYRGSSSSGPWTKLNTALLTTSAYNDSTAPAQATSYYQVKAVDTTAVESVPATTSVLRGIAFRSASSQKGTGSSLAITRPTGVVATDVLLAVIDIRSNGTITPPAGWTLVDSRTSGTALKQSAFVHVFQASDPTSYSWTFSGSQTSAGAILAYAGVNTVGPIDIASGQANASSTSIPAPAVTTTAQHAAVVGLFGTAANTTIAPPTTTAEQIEISATGKAKLTAEAADILRSVAGFTGSLTATAGSGAVNIGQVVALRPADESVPQDNSAPTAPGGLTATTSGTTVNLTWVASSDNVGVVHYEVFRDSVSIGTPTSTSFSDTGAAPNATHLYYVTAVDAGPNTSPASNTVSVTTSSIVFRGVSTKNGKNVSSLSMSKPAGTLTGDVLIASIDVRGSATVTGPTGWNSVLSTPSGSTLTKATFWHVVGSSDPGPYVFAFSSAQTAAGTMLAYGGVNTTTPIDASGSSAGTGTSILTNSLNANSTGSVLVSLVGMATNASITPTSGQLERGEIVGGSGSARVVSEASDVVVLAGATGNITATGSKSAPWTAQVLLLRPA